MSEVDLGLRLFLMDGATPGLLSFNGSLMLFGSTLFAVAQQAAALTGSIEKLQLGIMDAQTAFSAGEISAADFATVVGNNSAAIDVLAPQVDALNGAIAGLGIAAGSAIDLGLFATGLKTVTGDAMGLQTAFSIMSVAVTGSSGDMSKLQDLLISLANNSIYSTTELAYGFQLMGERGYTAAQIMDGNMGPALTHLAEAIGATGQSGVTGAAGILATALELFHAKASDATHYADLLTYAFYNGIPSADQLRSALEAVGGRAQLLGIPIDQVVVSLDALGRAGMQGSQAGAALNYMLTALSSPIPKAQSELSYLGLLIVDKTTPAFKAFTAQLDAAATKAGTVAPKFDGSVKSLDNMFQAAQSLGIVNLDAPFMQWAVSLGIVNSKFYDAKGHFIGLTEALHLLGTRLQSMNPEEKAAALSALFNVKSGQGATQLINNLIGIDKATTNLKKNSPGLALTDAQIIAGTASAAWKQFQTTFQDFGSVMGSTFLPTITNVLHTVNDFIGNLTLHNPQVMQFGRTFLLAGTLVSGAGVIFGVAIAAMSIATIPLVASMLPLIGIVLGVAAAIPFLVAAGIGLWNMFHSGNPLIQLLAGLLTGALLGALAAAAVSLWSFAGAAIMSFLATIPPAIAAGIAWLIAFAPFILIGAGIALLITGIILVVMHWGQIAHWLQGIWAGFVGWFQGVWKNVSSAVSGALGTATHSTQSFVGETGNKLHQAGQTMFQWAVNVGTAVVHAGQWLYKHNYYVQAIVDFAHNAWNVILSVIHTVVAGITTFLSVSWARIHAEAMLAWMLVSFYIIQPVQHAFSWLSGALSNVVGVVRSGFGFVQGIVQNVFGFISSIISSKSTEASNSVHTGLVNPIMNVVTGLGNWLHDAGANLMHMLVGGIMSAMGAVTNAASAVASNIWKVLGFHSPPKEGPLADSDQYMPNMMKMYAGHIIQHTPLLQSAIHGAASGLAFSSPGVQSALNTSSINRAASGGGIGSGATTTVNLNLDGKCVTQVVMDRITGTLQMNGVNRSLR